MSVIDSSIKFVGINPNYPTAEKKSSQVNAAQEVVTMQDIIDTVGSGSVPTLQEVLDNDHSLVDGNNFQGTNAGVNNTGVSVIAIGTNAASGNEAPYVIAIGEDAANDNRSTGMFCTSIGIGAGKLNEGYDLVAIGKDTANGNIGDLVIALGTSSANNNIGSNVTAIGNGAGVNNPLSNQFIISNLTLPSYANYSTALGAITSTGSEGCTYIFYDESDHIIKGIRL